MTDYPELSERCAIDEALTLLSRGQLGAEIMFYSAPYDTHRLVERARRDLDRLRRATLALRYCCPRYDDWWAPRSTRVDDDHGVPAFTEGQMEAIRKELSRSTPDMSKP
jgi:hypothetical protein